jgi:hypothetical protein
MRLNMRFTFVEWGVILIVCGIVSMFAFDELQARNGARDGRIDADADILAGTLQLKYAGKPPLCRNEMIAIFQERFGVSLEYIGGCCPFPYRSAYNSAYNDQMYAAIQLRAPTFDRAASYSEVRKLAEARREEERNAHH